MTVEIRFPRDDETRSDLESVLHINVVFTRFHLVVDGQPVMGELTSGEYFADYLYMFLKVSLKLLPRLADGSSGQFEFEGTSDLKFVSDGETVTVYLSDEYAEVSGDRYRMPLQAFAREVIETGEEFLDFALEVRPDERDNWTVEEFEEVIRKAKAWYRETYDEDV